MRRRIAIHFLIAFTSLFGAACQIAPGTQQINNLEARVADVEEHVGDLQVVVGSKLAEEKQQEKTQP